MAGELERRGELRWAERLEEGTMQGLVALLLTLRSGLGRSGRDDSGVGRSGRDEVRDAAEQAVVLIDREISDLRGLIAEMRADRAA